MVDAAHYRLRFSFTKGGDKGRGLGIVNVVPIVVRVKITFKLS
jgi:hypothetical protein